MSSGISEILDRDDEINIYDEEDIPVYVEILNGFLHIFSSVTDEYLFNIAFMEDEITLDIEKEKFISCDVNLECAICISEFVVDDDISELKCHHTFHFDCITQWGKMKQNCPLCREVIGVKENEFIWMPSLFDY